MADHVLVHYLGEDHEPRSSLTIETTDPAFSRVEVGMGITVGAASYTVCEVDSEGLQIRIYGIQNDDE